MAIKKDIPASGGSYRFKYSCPCAESITFSAESKEWAKMTVDETNSVITISAATSELTSSRQYTVIPILDGDKTCTDKSITIVQRGVSCDCSDFKPTNVYDGKAAGGDVLIATFAPSASTPCLTEWKVTRVDLLGSSDEWMIIDDCVFESDSQKVSLNSYASQNTTGHDRYALIDIECKNGSETCYSEIQFTQLGEDCDCNSFNLTQSSCFMWDNDEFGISNVGVDLTINSGSCHSDINVSVNGEFTYSVSNNIVTVAPRNSNTSSNGISGELEITYKNGTEQCTAKKFPLYQFGTKDYLRFEPTSDCWFITNVTSTTTYYSEDCGITWKTLTPKTKITVKACNPILLKATGTNYSGTNSTSYTQGISAFDTSGSFNIRGNIMSLIYGDNFEDNNTLPGEKTFSSIFSNSSVVDASGLILPATTLTPYCYRGMFDGCSRLKNAPILPATTLADSCYYEMFLDCHSLRELPNLPATTLKDSCYQRMFERCYGIISIPDNYLSNATVLDTGCYAQMFSYCTNLTGVSANLLQSTTLTKGCYGGMFAGCSKLNTVINLPATTLKEGCYASMFYGCKSLSSLPVLPATTMKEECYSNMFSNCEGITSIPNNYLPSATLAKKCYYSMFEGCTNLVTCMNNLPATRLSEDCYEYMFQGCTSLTTTPTLPSITMAEGCYDSMFRNCTSLTTAPTLPATNLEAYCYRGMFDGCSNLATAPNLPATLLKEACYKEMFARCTSLTTAPTLSASNLEKYCYQFMFANCTNLNSVTCLATYGVSSNWSTEGWLRNVAANGTFTKASSTTNWERGENGIPNGWTVQNA